MRNRLSRGLLLESLQLHKANLRFRNILTELFVMQFNIKRIRKSLYLYPSSMPQKSYHVYLSKNGIKTKIFEFDFAATLFWARCFWGLWFGFAGTSRCYSFSVLITNYLHCSLLKLFKFLLVFFPLQLKGVRFWHPEINYMYF